MSRRSREQRREDYLDIGAALVAESAMSGGAHAGLSLAHVKLAEVADRAGVTKGALYHLWPSQEAYWSDLLQHLMDSGRLFGTDLLTGTVRLPSAPDGDGPPPWWTIANALFEALRDDPMFFVRISLFSYLHDERVRSVLDEQFRVVVTASLPALRSAIHQSGRIVRDEEDLLDLAVSMSALLEGLCLQHRLSPTRTPELERGDGERWSLFAAGAEGLIVAYSDPAPTGSADAGAAGAAVGAAGGR